MLTSSMTDCAFRAFFWERTTLLEQFKERSAFQSRRACATRVKRRWIRQVLQLGRHGTRLSKVISESEVVGRVRIIAVCIVLEKYVAEECVFHAYSF